MGQEDAAKEQKTVIAVYGALCASLIVSCIPSLIMCFVSLVMFTGVLVVAYVIRGNALPESLAENHMTYVIRTIWITSLIVAVVTTAGSLTLLPNINQDPAQPCIQEIVDKILSGVMPGVEEMSAMMEPCKEAYMAANRMLFLITAIIAAIPVFSYLIVRIRRGFSRARGGYRLANPKAWL